MGSFFGILMAILTLGGGGDLLDLTSTASYWRVKGTSPTVEMLRATITDPANDDVSADIAKLGDADFKIRSAAREALAAKGSAIADQLKKGAENKDAEIASACRDLLAKLNTGQQQAIRKLMAIRTLGEMKDKDSAPALKKLLASKDPFVAEYAQRALDQITGESHPRAAVKIDDDINLLPKETGSVGQSRGLGNFNIDSFLDAVPETIQTKPDQKPEDARKETTDQITRSLLTLVEMTGDIRLDGVTVALSKDIGDDTGWAVVIVRGKFDRMAVAGALMMESRGEISTSEQDHVTVLTSRDARILFPSDDTAVLITGPGSDLADVQKTMLAALKTGKGELPQNADLAALLKQVDRTKDIWAAMRVPEIMKQEPIFTGVDTLTLQVSHKGDVVHFELAGTGPDADKVAASTAELKKNLEEVIAQGKQEAVKLEAMNSDHRAEVALIKRVLTMMDAIKITSNGKTATISGDIELLRQLGAYIATMLTVRMETVEEARPVAPVRPMPAAVVPNGPEETVVVKDPQTMPRK